MPPMKRGRFTDDEVREIRQSRRPIRALAEEYGVSYTAIRNIKDRRTYKHVPMKVGRFTDDEVREIRQSRRPIRALAEEYGVLYTAIRNIRDRRTYKHVRDDPGQEAEALRGLHKSGASTEGETLTDDKARKILRDRLTDATVRAIRQSKIPSRKLAEEFGVAPPTVIRIKNRLTYRHVPDDPGTDTFRNLYVRSYALDFLSGLPSGYCPTIVTSPPLFSMSNYSRQHMKLDEAQARADYINRQLEVIAECIRVAGDEGIVLYHTGLEIKDGLPRIYPDFRDDFPWNDFQMKVIAWDHLSPYPAPPDDFSDMYKTQSLILMFTGRDWKVPEESSAKGYESKGVWEIESMDLEEYQKVVRLTYNHTYSPSAYRRYLQRWWYSFPDELADRCIALGQGTVLDPFAGIGAVPFAAIRAGRHWLACDARTSLTKVFRGEAACKLMADQFVSHGLKVEVDVRRPVGRSNVIADMVVESRRGDQFLIECKGVVRNIERLNKQTDYLLQAFPEALGIVAVVFPDRLRSVDDMEESLRVADDLMWQFCDPHSFTTSRYGWHSGSVEELATQFRDTFGQI